VEKFTSYNQIPNYEEQLCIDFYIWIWPDPKLTVRRESVSQQEASQKVLYSGDGRQDEENSWTVNILLKVLTNHVNSGWEQTPSIRHDKVTTSQEEHKFILCRLMISSITLTGHKQILTSFRKKCTKRTKSANPLSTH
jgi:hypothetical protein